MKLDDALCARAGHHLITTRHAAADCPFEFKGRLRTLYLDPEVSDELAEKVFRQAWEDGHASGEYEVEQIFEGIADLVNAAFTAGKNHG